MASCGVWERGESRSSHRAAPDGIRVGHNNCSADEFLALYSLAHAESLKFLGSFRFSSRRRSAGLVALPGVLACAPGLVPTSEEFLCPSHRSVSVFISGTIVVSEDRIQKSSGETPAGELQTPPTPDPPLAILG